MIYVLSDIHGNERRFASVLEQIRLRPEDTLYVLGDVIDRYPGGIPILRRLMAMPNARMLLGNHEYMMLRALGQPRDSNFDDGRALEHWYRNGGKVTHEHLKRLRKSLRQEIVDYLHSLPLHYDVELNGTHYKLVHGDTEENFDPNFPSPVYYAVWKRFESMDPPPEGYTLVFGHTPTRYYQSSVPMKIWHDGSRIGIDCGSGYPEEGLGRLACLRLDDGAEFYSAEPERKEP